MRRTLSLVRRPGIAAGAGLLALLWTASSAFPQDAVPANDSLRGQEYETVIVTAPRKNADYTLGPSDKLRITVYGEDDLSGEFQIDGAGTVRLPLIGQVKAAGLTAPQLEARVEEALDHGYLLNARVAIEVTAYRPIYIIGQVNKPGEYPYVSNMSALNAIALAGGFSEKAVESTLYVRHDGETEEHAVTADGSTRINPGDVVRVRESFFWDFADVLSPLTGLAYVATAAAAT